MDRLRLNDLTGWLGRQRWFAGKGRMLEAAVIHRVTPIEGAEASVWLVVARATYLTGPSDDWLLVLGTADGAPSIGRIGRIPVTDVGDSPEVARTLLQILHEGWDGTRGLTTTSSTGWPPPADAVRLMGVEQSNTSVVVGDALAVKVIRRVEPGPNPDVEVTAALTAAGFAGTPGLIGALTGADDAAHVVVTQMVADAAGAWEEAVTEAGGGSDRRILDGMRELGVLTAAMHRTLADALPTATATAADSQRLRDRIAGAADRLGDVLSARPTISDTLAPSLGEVQRIHGDFHLGQVLHMADGGWRILDFEGEPGRPVSERRMLDSPLRDVAGMLRSLAYVEAVAVREGGDPAKAAQWRAAAEVEFLDGYGVERHAPLLDAFMLDKLLYEVAYEAANRPDWLDIPLRALDALSPAGPVAAPRQDAPSAAAPPADPPSPLQAAVEAMEQGDVADPHMLLGRHQLDDGRWVVRLWRPDAERAVLSIGDTTIPAERVWGPLFAAEVDADPDPGAYRWTVTYPNGDTFTLVDPYAFPPSLGEIDLHLLAEGRHEQAWTVLGANRQTFHGINGVSFAVWAPSAQSVRLVGEFNDWDGRLNPMRRLGASGIWELFMPDVADGARYKFEMVTATGALTLKADPWARWTEVPPETASRVFTSDFTPTASAPTHDSLHEPMSIYEVHAGSWRWGDNGPLSYRELAVELADYVVEMGFTHVELMPVAEHPFGGSWGYQVTGQFAPTSRFGTPDDFRFLVDHMHERGIGVLVDWVPAHFPKDEFALARFDGTALYEHADPRQGEHPDWGTLVFNYGRTEVRNFIVASALFWLESLGVDGLRVDAVASMLYLDYSRKEGEWIPNAHGGRENLEAVQLLQEVNATAYKRNPGTITIAEESTAWPGVSRPTHLGGLGFGFKWNMGWMHDTLSYFAKEPVYRRWHHNQLTFGLMYAWSEHFVLPLSHDEVVHGKGSLLGKMPGDAWQRAANLRALFGWMWGHPGKQLLFMGGEFGQEREWSEERQLDWFLVNDNGHHRGIQSLVRDANLAYRSLPALWRRDDDPAAFQWIDANNADENLLSFVREGAEGDRPVAVIANMSPTPRYDVPIGLPRAGLWEEVLNTDAEPYGGGNVGNLGAVEAIDEPFHGLPASARVTVPPLGVVWLALE